jgi:hypothetical protein
MVRNLSRFSGQILKITQPSIWKKNYEIKYNDELLGKITPENILGTRILISIFENEWEIYKPGFWKSEIAVREKGKENPFATYNKKFFAREGTVFLPMGQRLKIKFGLTKRKYGVYTTSGICLASIKDEISLRASSLVYIENSSEMLDKYPWAIILAWYLTRKRKQAAAAG